MGGNALKNCVTRRYQADEFDEITSEIGHKIFGKNITVTRIPSYFSKESHGDLDLLVKSETLPANWVELVVEMFKPQEYIKNGNVLSFEYKQLQVDLIVTPEENWLSSWQYFAFNDLGNLIGRVAHKLGLKLGHDGLSYGWRIDTHAFKTITLLKDWKDILPVLGYSYERYAEGFDTLEDIFEFVVSSRFFNKAIYELDNRNHTSRVRDRKRKTYMEFLKWLDGYQETNTQNALKYSVTDKKVHLPYLFAYIRDFKAKYEETEKEYNQAVAFKSRFNGDLVRSWTGLEGKELGAFMKWLKEVHPEDKLQRTIMVLNPDVIEPWTKHFVNLWKAQQ